MKYKYHFFDGEFLPVMDIVLKSKKDSVNLRAFIDTGASYCLVHADVTEILGIDMEAGEKTEMVLGDGNILTVYLHGMVVSIGRMEFNARIGFSKGLGTGFDIIGRKGIFDKFKVCFNERDKEVELIPHQ
jgi:predicted aspartyl protease